MWQGRLARRFFLASNDATRWAGILLICFGVAMWVDDLPSSLHCPPHLLTIRWAILGWPIGPLLYTSWESIRRGAFFEWRIKSQ